MDSQRHVAMTVNTRTINPWKPIQLLVWIPGILYVLSRLLPCHPVDVYADWMPTEDAWVLCLHAGFAQHLQFGQDIVFTYGPWGFLGRGYYPATFWISMLCWLALSFVYIRAGWHVARFFTDSVWVAWLWLTAFAAVATIPLGNDFNDRVTAWAVLLLFVHFFVEERAFSPLEAALAFTLAWLGLVKFTSFMEGGFLVAVIGLDTVFRHRRFPWIIPVWLSGILFFWALAGQHLYLLWPFLKNSWDMAGGYTDAMNKGDLLTLDPFIYVFIGVGICVLGTRLLPPPRRTKGMFFLAGMGGILFFAFKESYVRSDNWHAITAVTTLVLIALACLAVVVKRKSTSLIITAAVIFCASLGFALSLPEHQKQQQGFFHQLARTFSRDSLMSPILCLTTQNMSESWESLLSRLRRQAPLPPVAGEVDLYSTGQDYLFASGLAYRPRPIIQSYSAYTPELARLNADWLRSGRAAPNLYFAIQPIDERIPSLDDGLSWPELLTLYDVIGVSDKKHTYLRLLRSPTPRQYRIEPLQEMAVTCGKTIILPLTNNLIWVEMEIKKTLAGDLVSFCYKPGALMVKLKLSDRTSRFCQIIPGMASAGFLLSPYISSNDDFVALACENQAVLARKKVVAITLYQEESPHQSFYYQPEIKIRLYCLNFPAQNPKINFLKESVGKSASGDEN